MKTHKIVQLAFLIRWLILQLDQFLLKVKSKNTLFLILFLGSDVELDKLRISPNNSHLQTKPSWFLQVKA